MFSISTKFIFALTICKNKNPYNHDDCRGFLAELEGFNLRVQESKFEKLCFANFDDAMQALILLGF